MSAAFTPAVAGSYYLFCRPHEALGMVGEVHVHNGETEAPAEAPEEEEEAAPTPTPPPPFEDDYGDDDYY